ncbi:glucose-1-phosphate adenylyltransferase [bacterium]|nr:glucose-1-phosphate adenylyltransferase [bacterium]
MAQNALAVIMGGGKGSRLRPLTQLRTKPAVPIGGKYRLIDIPVSNCLNSGIGKIYILTQFNSESLHSHITETYKFDYFSKSFVKILAAEQSIKTDAWYQGTADAVRKNIMHLKSNSKKDDLILILSGDQLYKMDFTKIIQAHIKKKAEITISTKVVGRHQAKSLGLLNTNTRGKIIDFAEKPEDDATLNKFEIEKNKFLGSMGIYVFNRDLLFDLLNTCTEDDFGKGIIPSAIFSHNVYAHQFNGFWEDIGTIKSFYEANIGIATGKLEKKFNFNGIFTRPRFLQPTKMNNCAIENSIISDGCNINSATIKNSLIGLRSIIGENCQISDTVIMGSDGYEDETEMKENKKENRPNIGIGNNVIIKKAIVDKNAKIGNNVIIENKKNIIDFASENYVIKDGIVIIPKSTIIPDGTRI